MSRKLTKSDFIKKSKLVHGSTYKYRLVDYVNNSTKVDIICSYHNIFKQTPANHLKGQGCPKCGRLSTAINTRNNPPGWSYVNWSKAAEKSKNFKSFKVYIIRCWNSNEEFYKIGRTYVDITSRFRTKPMMPYNYEIVFEIVFDKSDDYLINAKEAFDKENELKRLHKGFKYSPLINFEGEQECFSKIISYI